MSEEFCTGVKILLQRMETHPEEFYKKLIPNDYESIKDAKWHDIMHSIMTTIHEGKKVSHALFFTDAEFDALYEGYKKIRRKAFDDRVMGEVLAPDEELSSPRKSKSALTKKQIINDSLQILQKEMQRQNPYSNTGVQAVRIK
jgi:hypothetical protein